MFGVPNSKNSAIGTPNVNALRNVKNTKMLFSILNKKNFLKKSYIWSAKP